MLLCDELQRPSPISFAGNDSHGQHPENASVDEALPERSTAVTRDDWLTAAPTDKNILTGERLKQPETKPVDKEAEKKPPSVHPTY